MGDVPGSILSPFKWYRLLMGFYEGPRDPTAPFFTARDGVRPYTYAAASADLHAHLSVVSPEDTAFGLHGLRVEGYNLAKRIDEGLAVAVGGWQEGSHTRYDRFDLRTQVFPLASQMLGVAPPAATQAVAPRPLGRGRSPNMGRRRATVAAAPSAAPAEAPEEGPSSEEESSSDEDDLHLDGEDEDASAQREILAALRAERGEEASAHADAARRIADMAARDERAVRWSGRLAGEPADPV